MIVVRLPGTVKEVFEQRVRAAMPLRADRILARTREVRGGKFNDPRFGTRQTGEGQYAESIAQLFDRTAHRLGLVRGNATPVDTPSTFRRPGEKKQLDLFAAQPGRGTS
jgi:DNA repair photolyase